MLSSPAPQPQTELLHTISAPGAESKPLPQPCGRPYAGARHTGDLRSDQRPPLGKGEHLSKHLKSRNQLPIGRGVVWKLPLAVSTQDSGGSNPPWFVLVSYGLPLIRNPLRSSDIPFQRHLLEDFLGQLLVEASRQRGLSQVISQTLGFEGMEFYIAAVQGTEGWAFGDLLFAVSNCIPIGYMDRGKVRYKG